MSEKTISANIIELGQDFKTHYFNKKASNQITLYLENKKCNFCESALDLNRAGFYQHEGGWKLTSIKEKIWIWFECSTCHHQWSINHLGVSRNTIIKIVDNKINNQKGQLVRQSEGYYLYLDNNARILVLKFNDLIHFIPNKDAGPIEKIQAKNCMEAIRIYSKSHNLNLRGVF